MELPMLNEKPFEYVGRNGVVFSCSRCDFKEPVSVIVPEGVSLEKQCADFAEFGSYHALNIHPRLAEFSGYATVEYVFVGSEERRAKQRARDEKFQALRGTCREIIESLKHISSVVNPKFAELVQRLGKQIADVAEDATQEVKDAIK